MKNSFANIHLANFRLRIATDLVEPDDDHSDQLLFLTKNNLKSGIRKFENREVFLDLLERVGVALLSSETLSLAEQIRLWRRHTLIGGFEGSALHTALFVRRKKLVSISTQSLASSNQVLINELADHQSLYLNSNGSLIDQPGKEHFQISSRLVDPEATARSFLRAFDYMSTSNESMKMRTIRDTVSPWLFIDEPFGSNLTRGKSTDMSSADPNWTAHPSSTTMEASGAVSGKLSGRYQFHSSPEKTPWWIVDLDSCCLINEVCVFNRHDVAQHRARHLVIARWHRLDKARIPNR